MTDNPDEYFNGNIDGIHFYHRAMESDEVAKTYLDGMWLIPLPSWLPFSGRLEMLLWRVRKWWLHHRGKGNLDK